MGRRGLDVLARVPLFSGLSSRSLRKVLDLFEDARYMEGATIVREGDPGDSFYVVLGGEAKVLNRAGKVINRLVPGDFFGEISLLDGGARTATIVAATPLVTIMLPRGKFRKMLQADSTIAVGMLRQLSADLRRIQRSVAG